MNTGIDTSMLDPVPSKRQGARAAIAALQAFTLVEILIVITVILILVGLVMTVVGSATRSGYIAATRQTVEMIQSAMDVYASEHHVLPPTAAGNALASNLGTSLPPQTLDLLVPDGFILRPERLSATTSPRILLDDWNRQISYTADSVPGAVLSLNPPIPAALWPKDWNPQKKIPFAYIWSYGVPTGHGDAWDANAANNCTSWIHPTLSP
jgi:type II secretory pathway pseudopilin PulG